MTPKKSSFNFLLLFASFSRVKRFSIIVSNFVKWSDHGFLFTVFLINISRGNIYMALSGGA